MVLVFRQSFENRSNIRDKLDLNKAKTKSVIRIVPRWKRYRSTSMRKTIGAGEFKTPFTILDKTTRRGYKSATVIFSLGKAKGKLRSVKHQRL